LIVPDGRGEQAMTRFVMRSGDTPIAYGGGGFMVLDPPPGVKLIPVPMRKQSDPEPVPLAPDDLTEPEARIFAQGEAMLARAATDGVAFIDRFWGGSAWAVEGGASATLDNGAHIANRVKHVQGGILLRIGNSKHLSRKRDSIPGPGMRSLARVSGGHFSTRDTLRGSNRRRPRHFDGFARARVEPDRRPRCRTALASGIRPPGTTPAAAPGRAAGRAQASPGA
jgi:hypothetical protein